MFKDTIKSHRLAVVIPVKLSIGDWSGDGHGMYKDVLYSVNYPLTDLQQAYKESCKVRGIQFNHNENFVVPRSKSVYGQILTEYGDCYINPKDVDILFQFGVLTDERLESIGLSRGEYGIQITEAEELGEILMNFIAHSMPDDFVYERVEDYDIPCINRGSGLNTQFGYGIFY